MNYKRQLSFFNPDEYDDTCITVIGCGGIGSFVVKHLAQMGLKNIKVYDNDTVEEHNLPNQDFDMRHIGMHKVEAMQSIVKERTGVDIKGIPKKANGNTRFKDTDILILATDNIKSREMCFNSAVKHGVPYVIDGRLGGEYYQVITIDTVNYEQVDEYRNQYLFDDKEAIETSCTARAIIYIALDITSDIIRHTRDIMKGNHVPFMIETDRNDGMFVVDGKVLAYTE